MELKKFDDFIDESNDSELYDLLFECDDQDIEYYLNELFGIGKKNDRNKQRGAAMLNKSQGGAETKGNLMRLVAAKKAAIARRHQQELARAKSPEDKKRVNSKYDKILSLMHKSGNSGMDKHLSN